MEGRVPGAGREGSASAKDLPRRLWGAFAASKGRTDGPLPPNRPVRLSNGEGTGSPQEELPQHDGKMNPGNPRGAQPPHRGRGTVLPPSPGLASGAPLGSPGPLAVEESLQASAEPRFRSGRFPFLPARKRFFSRITFRRSGIVSVTTTTRKARRVCRARKAPLSRVTLSNFRHLVGGAPSPPPTGRRVRGRPRPCSEGLDTGRG